MIKSNNKKIKAMVLIATIAAVAAGIFRMFILVNYIEPESGFYIANTNMNVVFNAVMIGIVVLVGVCGFLVRKVQAPAFLDSRSTVVVFTSALCAFMYFSLFLYGIYMLVFQGRQLYLVEGTQKYFLYAQVVLCIPCCFNHISVCSSVVREKNTPHALFSMSEAVFFAVRTVEVFMNTDSQINVSQRSLELLMLCSMMLFFLFEASFLVNREEGNPKSIAKFFMAGIATMMYTVIAVIPYLAVSLFWCFESDLVIMDVLECCIMLFAISRLVTLRDQ